MSAQKITPAQIRHTAHLARLHLTPEEQKAYTAQVADILNYVDQLKQVDTEGVAPTYQVNNLKNIFRSDDPHPSLPVDLALSTASARKDDYLVTPPTIIFPILTPGVTRHD